MLVDPEQPLKALLDRACVGHTRDGLGATFHFEGGRRLVISPAGDLSVEVDVEDECRP